MRKRRTAVAYFRRFKDRIRERAFGIEAQRVLVSDFADAYGFSIVADYVEISNDESTLHRRPRLLAALNTARKRKAPILVANSACLSQYLDFVTDLAAKRVTIIVANQRSSASPFALNLFPVVSRECKQHESAHIQKVTFREPLINYTKPEVYHTDGVGTPHRKRRVSKSARRMAPIMKLLLAQGIVSAPQMARALNARGETTPRGGEWKARSVLHLLRQFPKLSATRAKIEKGRLAAKLAARAKYLEGRRVQAGKPNEYGAPRREPAYALNIWINPEGLGAPTEKEVFATRADASARADKLVGAGRFKFVQLCHNVGNRWDILETIIPDTAEPEP
jgi:hypothetical protein